MTKPKRSSAGPSEFKKAKAEERKSEQTELLEQKRKDEEANRLATKETVHLNEKEAQELNAEKTKQFLITVWIKKELVDTRWDEPGSKQRNRNLDHKKVATMREKWSKTEGSNLQRTVIQHAVILTIKKEDSKGFLEQFKDAKGKSHDPNFLRISSMSPVNFTGQIFDLPESLTTVLKGSTILRCEAGQHRLEAIQSLEVGDHVGLWPAQIYLRDFSPAMLEALRRNVELISFRETTEDVLFKLSSYFPIEKSLTPADKKTFDSLYKTIGGKMRTSLNKEWGHLVKDITGVFPNFCQGWNENKASGLNKSIHNDKIKTGLSQIKRSLEILFPEDHLRSLISAHDFLHLNELSSLDATWFASDSDDILSSVFKNHFVEYRKASKKTESELKLQIESAQSFTSGLVKGPGLCMQYPQGMAGLSDVHNNGFLNTSYIFMEVAAWVAPWGSFEASAVGLSLADKNNTFNVRLSKAAPAAPGQITELSWTRFMRRRKMLACSPQKLKNIPAGNLALQDLMPQEKEILKELGVATRPEANNLDFEKAGGRIAAWTIENFILGNQNALMSEWNSEASKKSTNLKADCSLGKFPKTEAELGKALTSAMEYYRTRFSKPTWMRLFKLVRSFYPILWYVVDPTVVLKVNEKFDASQVQFDFPEIRRSIRSIFSSDQFKKVSLEKSVETEWQSARRVLFVDAMIRAIPSAVKESERLWATMKPAKKKAKSGKSAASDTDEAADDDLDEEEQEEDEEDDEEDEEEEQEDDPVVDLPSTAAGQSDRQSKRKATETKVSDRNLRKKTAR